MKLRFVSFKTPDTSILRDFIEELVDDYLSTINNKWKDIIMKRK